MSKFKGTPGPWSVDDNHGKRYIEPIWSNEPVAVVCKKKGDEFLANARLIAAAPALLEALQDALLWVDGSTKVKVRAAIAKALGEDAP